jgi:NAD-dependent protein deacetylase/lipoamidase
MTDESASVDGWLLDRSADLIAGSGYCTALIGAGISRDSGVPTYRGAGGLWTRDGAPPMDQYQRFRADPLGWWSRRIDEERNPGELAAAIQAAHPNSGHIALARLERLGVLHSAITQNIDNLHQIAGSEKVLEIHGNRTRLRCTGCGKRWSNGELEITELPPRCSDCGDIIKSDTVMFGEPIPPSVLDACFAAARRSDCMLVIGTSAVVYPAAELPLVAQRRGADLIEINPEATALSPLCHISLQASAAAVLPDLVDRVESRLKTGPR